VAAKSLDRTLALNAGPEIRDKFADPTPRWAASVST